MIRGFNISFYKELYKTDPDAIEAFRKLEKRKVENLSAYLLDTATIDAKTVIEKVFPSQKVDIFLSHSHDDRDAATQLAIYLKEKCDLNVFVDSCVWGSADELLQKIDDLHCRDNSSENYRYIDRNRSTAHVHMILATALQQMIDRADTLFFLNTDKSLSTKHSIKDDEKTLSPWIHMELMFSSLVRRKPQPSFEDAAVMDGIKRYDVAHEAPLKHLTSLTHGELVTWMASAAGLKGSAAIRRLYNNHPD